MVKRLKDANAPKRPMSPYFKWMKMNRKRVVRSMPVGYSFKELSTKLGEMWASLPEEEKVKLNEQYKEEMKVHVKLMAAYKHTSNYTKFRKQKEEHDLMKAKSKKFHKDPNKPKAPSSAYFLFLADKREETKMNFPNLSHKELVSKLGELWNKLSEVEKQPYVAAAKQEKMKWLEAIKEYKNTENYKEYMEAKRVFNKSRKTKIEKIATKSAGKQTASTKKVTKSMKKKVSKSRSRSRSAKKVTKSKKKKVSKSRSRSRSAKKATKPKKKKDLKNRSRSRSRSKTANSTRKNTSGKKKSSKKRKTGSR